MQILRSISDVKSYVKQCKSEGKTVGFVPTMGYLHEGHLSLIRRASRENDTAIVSIFVNPTQFGPSEDFERYPRDLERDSALVREGGGHIIFCPNVSEMYPNGYKTYVNVEDITETLCGASRPGHFRGVATVVTKLLNIVNADKAYFGQKDAQQCLVIQQMVQDLNMDCEIVICPIIREKDGLAMSSRNVYLSSEERTQALVLSQSLKHAEELIRSGERKASAITSLIKSMIEDKPLARIDYISVVDGKSLKPVEELGSKILVALAVKFGNTRLIDNIILEV